MIEFFKAGGFTMWLVLLLGLVSVGAAIAGAALAFGRRRAAIVTLGALSVAGGICTGAAGVGAYFWALSRVMDAVATVDPAFKARLLAAGISEAMNNIVLGAALAVLPILVGTAVLVRGLFLPSKQQQEQGGARSITTAMLMLLAAAAVACGCDESTEQPSAAPVPDAGPTGCAPGQTAAPDALACIPAGTPADACDDGFVADADGSCTATLPSEACGEGRMAVPGQDECVEVAPCGEGPYGAAPALEATEYVDAAYAGGASDGSVDRPWVTIGQGLEAASPGATVAIAAGRYVEDVVIGDKPVVLWGRCPTLVEIEGSAESTAAVVVRSGAEGTEIHDLAITGGSAGVTVRGSTDVRLERVWIHDTAGRGLVVEPWIGASGASLDGCLIERASDIGAFVYDALLEVVSSVVRGTSPGAGWGRGIVARQGASLSLRQSVVERNRDHGVLVSGATAQLEGSVVRDTLPDGSDAFGGGVTVRRDSDTGEPADVRIAGSAIERNHYYGVYVEGSRASVERTVIRDTHPQASDGELGVGLQAQDDELPSELTVIQSVVTRNTFGGIAVTGSSAVIESTVVSDVQPDAQTGAFGRGVLAYDSPATGLGATATVVDSVVERCHEAGLSSAGASLEIVHSAIRDIAPRPTDGMLGRGVSVHSQDTSWIPSTLTMVDCRVERTFEFGVLVEGSHATIEGTAIVDTSTQQPTGLFGDAVAVATLYGAPADNATAQLFGNTMASAPRAGVASFGAEVRLSNNTFECDAIDINGQPTTIATSEFVDEGGNACGCAGQGRTCQVATTELEPPSADPL